MEPDGSHQVRLTQDAHNEGYSVLSPDGKSIAYHEDTTNSGCYELFVMNADGTSPRQLTPDGDCNWGPSWTHDGSGLLFGTTRDGNFDIYTMRTDWTEQTRLTSNAARNDAFPMLSPDGTKIAFTSWDAALDSNSAEVYVMNVDGTGRTRLTNNSFEDSYPAWSPDSKQSRVPEQSRRQLRDLHDERRRLRRDAADEDADGRDWSKLALSLTRLVS